jgi:hypothetical protein
MHPSVEELYHTGVINVGHCPWPKVKTGLLEIKKRLALAGKSQIVLAEFNRQQINEKQKLMYS